MPFTNIKADHLSATQQKTVADLLTDLEAALTGLPTLTPQERQQYGSVNETNKLLVNKVKDQYNDQPAMASPDVNWPEFTNDYTSRGFYESMIARLQTIITGMDNAKILHDYDNYQDALADYSYAQYRYGRGISGYENKVNELKQFFPRTSGLPAGENPA